VIKYRFAQSDYLAGGRIDGAVSFGQYIVDGFGLNHHPPSTMYIVIDQKPSAGGVSPFATDTVYLFVPVSC
jgi:hypothetical protein